LVNGKKWGLFFAVLLLLSGSYIINYFFFVPVNFVGIDINPSIQLATNRLNRVVDVVPLNEEADILLSDIDLDNMLIEQATEEIISGGVEMGYIDELAVDNAIVISVANGGDEEPAVIESKISDRVERFLTKRNIPAVVLLENDNAERKALAEQYGVSYGKMLLIQKAVALNPDLNEAELVDFSTKEIARTIKDARVEIRDTRRLERRQELIREKEEIKNSFKEEYNRTIQDMVQKDDRLNQDLTVEEKEQIRQEIINEKKEAIKDIVDEARDEVKRDWSENNNGSTDIDNNEMPKPMRDRIENIRGRWAPQPRE